MQGIDSRLYENHFTVGVGWSGWRELFGQGLSPAGPGSAASADTLSWVVQWMDKGVYLNQRSITTSAAAAVSGGEEEEDLLR
jgi:hypothetical protein